MGGQAVVGIAEVPQIVGDDEHPGHVRPQHVLTLLGDIDAEPAGHAGDVEQARDAVEHVVPAAVERDALGGNPRGAEGAEGALEVAHHGDEDVDGHDDEGEGLEPMRAADLAPGVLQHHEADAAGGGGVHLGVVEPAVHVGVGGVVHGPLGTGRRTDLHGQAVDGHGAADAEEHEDAAGLGAAGEFVQQDERDEHHRQAEPLEAGVRAVHVE